MSFVVHCVGVAVLLLLSSSLATVLGQTTLQNCRPTSSERLLFYTTDTLGEFPFTHVQETKGHLKMMRGEYKLEGRNTTFSLPSTAPRPTYAIDGWEYHTDKQSNNVTTRTIGYSAGFHITGPAIGHKNKAIYYISRHCILNDTSVNVNDPTTVAVKLGGTQQQDPHGGSSALHSGCTIKTAFSNQIFALQRYNWLSNTWDLIHQGTGTSFPGNNEFNQEHWQLAFDPNTNKLWYNIYDNALTGDSSISGVTAFFVSNRLWSIDTTVTGNMKSPVNEFNITTTEQGAYHQMVFDCESNLFIQDYGKIHRLQVTQTPMQLSYPVPKPHIQNTLCGGSVSCYIGGFAVDPVNRVVFYNVYLASTRYYQIRKANYEGTQDSVMYTRVLYEFPNLGQHLMNMDIDVANQHLYLVSYGSNVKGRSIQRFDILDDGVTATGCLWGYQSDCKFRLNGEEHIVGYVDAADAAYKLGAGASSNWQRGEVLSYDSGNTIFAVVGPTQVEPRGKCNATWQKNHVHARDRSVSYTCDPIVTSQDFTRRIFFQVEPGLASDRTFWLAENRGWNQMELLGSATFADGGVYKFRTYYSTTTENYKNYNWLHNAGIDQTNNNTMKRRGVSICGPTYSKKQRKLYYLSCEAGWQTDNCMEYALWRMDVDTLKKELVYRAPRQLMPAPSQFTWSKCAIAIDDQREVVYLLMTPYNGYGANQKSFEQLYSYDLKDQALPLSECSAQLETEFPELDGSIRTMHVDTCDGSVWIQETSNIWRWRVKENMTAWMNIKVPLNDTTSGNLTASGSRYFGGLALDDKDGYLYFTYVSGLSGTSAKRGIVRVKKTNALEMEFLYRNANYELSYAASIGGRPQYLRQLTLDLLNRQIYVVSYYGNSYQRSLLMLPMPGHDSFTGGDGFVCLYGHPSILHARGASNGNRDCLYVGPEPAENNYTGYDVPLPYGALYQTTSSSQLVVLPPPQGQRSNPASPVDGIIGGATVSPGGTSGDGGSPAPSTRTAAPSGFLYGGSPSLTGTSTFAVDGCCSENQCTTPKSSAVSSSRLVFGRQYRDYYLLSSLVTRGESSSSSTSSLSGGSSDSDSSTPSKVEIHVKGQGNTLVRFMVMTYAEWQKYSPTANFNYFADLSVTEWTSCASAGANIVDASLYDELRLIVDYDEPADNGAYTMHVSHAGRLSMMVIFVAFIAVVVLLL